MVNGKKVHCESDRHGLKLPDKEGGYLLTAEYYPAGQSDPVISRRYIKVGGSDTAYRFFEMKP